MGVKNVVLDAGDITKIDPHYDMTLNDAMLIKQFRGGNIESISCAFNYGYLQGVKAANSAGINEGNEGSCQSSMAETIIKKINAADEEKIRNLSLSIDVFLEDETSAKSI